MDGPGHIEQALVYRSSPKALRAAWSAIALSIVTGLFFFIIIPLTATLPKEEKKIHLREVPSPVQIKPEEEKTEPLEKIYDNKPAEPLEVQPIPTPPLPQPPPPAPVKIELSSADFSTDISFDTSVNSDFDFQIEKAAQIVQNAKSIPEKTAPLQDQTESQPPQQKTANINKIFGEGEVDSKAIRPPGEPFVSRRYQRFQGKISFQCIIGQDGVPYAIQLISSEISGLEVSCAKFLRENPWQPAIKNGQPVRQKTIVTYEFKRQK